MKYISFISALLFFNLSFAQPSFLFRPTDDDEEVFTGPSWETTNKASVYLSQVSFVNWNAGGTNSISGLMSYQTSANYTDKYYTWKNDASLKLGMTDQQGSSLQKSDDIFSLSSNFSYQSDDKSNWFYSAKLTFNTQLFNGYTYSSDSRTLISSFLAPGYLYFGGGMEYGKNVDKMSIYFSPVTLKTTFVLEEDLANAGSYGVDPAVYDDDGNIISEGERIRSEVGILITNSYEMAVMKNVNLKNQVSLYSDYLNNFGNVDVDWSLDFDFKVNDYIKASFGSQIKYDDDVKTVVETDDGETAEAGAKVQWRQFLGVGFAVDF
ncbi:DUF3078 domain-containing protein [Neotamlana laminarinivorans]|uniref:DUF3078 domain-containing protein n=1 Tax=Neotamlana laminarinivorans TaxID=2883124 RepID=A0A9X1I063_9FLAO|nr:DUF3078 domain-containing protein [Tamlana laminarinivorans]MCB4797857.1 DUF3078 domain-containing protein [Tamlana laminarinivorans]